MSKLKHLMRAAKRAAPFLRRAFPARAAARAMWLTTGGWLAYKAVGHTVSTHKYELITYLIAAIVAYKLATRIASKLT